MKYFLSYMAVAVLITIVMFVVSGKNSEDKAVSAFAGAVWPMSVLVIGIWFSAGVGTKLFEQYQVRRRMKVRNGKCKAKELQRHNEWMMTISKDTYPYDATTKIIHEYRKLYKV